RRIRRACQNAVLRRWAGRWWSPEVSGRCGGHGQVEGFEAVGDEGDDAFGGLDVAADEQRGAGARDKTLPGPQTRGDEDIGHAGLVLHVEERDPARGGGALPVIDRAADPHPGAVLRDGEFGGGDSATLVQ